MPAALAASVAAASLFVLLLALGGCAVGPAFTRPEAPVAKTWRERGDPRVETAAVPDIRWWKAFNDSTLERLVEVAYQQNLSLHSAGLRIVEARAQVGIATGRQFPQQQVLFARAAAVGLSRNAANVTGFDRHFVDYQIGFDASWELDLWGKYRRAVDAAAASELASVADYQNAIVSLTAEVARTYVVIRTFDVLIEQAQKNAQLQEEGLRIAESRFRNGATSELDVTQAKSLLASTRASIPQLQTSLEQARNAMSTLLGQPTDTVDVWLAGPKVIPQAPSEVAVSAPADLLRRRPDVRSAELAAAAQCALIGVAEADLYPSFSVLGTFGAQSSSAAGAPDSINPADSLFYAFGLRIAWPFFNYGRIENNVRLEDARFQQAVVAYRDTVLRAAQEVEDALAGFLNGQDAMAFEQSSVEAAQRAEEIAVVQYREGAVDYQRVLDAQRSLLQQQNSLAQTRSSIATSLIALYKALGGGWESREGDPIVPDRMRNEMQERTNWGGLLAPQSGSERKASAPLKVNAPPGTN